MNEDFVNTQKNNNILGTGMFQVAEKTDNTIKLVKNENYWNEEKESLLTEINITLYGTIGEVYTAFKTGYIDLMDITVPDVQTYIGSIGYNKIDYADRNIDFVSFNTASELFADPSVRKAIALFLDKNNIIANIGAGYKYSDFAFDTDNWLILKRLQNCLKRLVGII